MMQELENQDWHATSCIEAKQGEGDPFAAAVRATRMPMIVTDPRLPDNPIVFANNAFLRLTGYDKDEVLGHNCRFLQGADTDPVAIAMIRDALAEKKDIAVDVLNYRKDGTPFWNALYLSPVSDGKGELQFFFASQMDVSDRIEMQIMISHQRELLEREVAKRTQDLQEALVAKTLLVHEVDHRVKNNLQMISAILGMQIRNVKDTFARDLLESILQRIESIGSVHRQLYQSQDISRFDLDKFIRDTFEETSNASGRSIKLSFEMETITVPAQQASSLVLVLNEILINSLKHAFLPNQAGTISVSMRKQNGHLKIDINDNGKGASDYNNVDGGFGSKFVKSVVRQLRGNVTWRSTSPGTGVAMSIPLSSLQSGESQ